VARIANTILLSSLALLLFAAQAEAKGDNRRFGVMLDAGLPDGANGSLVYRPWSWLRVHAGGGYNLVSPGVRAGLTLAPFSGSATLTANIDGGRYFIGDANPLARMLTGDDSVNVAVLREVGYDYANFHAGFEWGRQWATFYIHAGMSYVHSEIRNANATFSDIDPSTTFEFKGDPKVNVWTPSLRLGLIVYFAR
jgi:hypothetical protein